MPPSIYSCLMCACSACTLCCVCMILTYVHSRVYVAGQVDCSLDSSVLLCRGLWEGRQSRSRPRFGSVHYCPLYLRAMQRGGHRRDFGTCCVKVFGQGGVGHALTERALPGQGWGGV